MADLAALGVGPCDGAADMVLDFLGVVGVDPVDPSRQQGSLGIEPQPDEEAGKTKRRASYLWAMLIARIYSALPLLCPLWSADADHRFHLGSVHRLQAPRSPG